MLNTAAAVLSLLDLTLWQGISLTHRNQCPEYTSRGGTEWIVNKVPALAWDLKKSDYGGPVNFSEDLGLRIQCLGTIPRDFDSLVWYNFRANGFKELFCRTLEQLVPTYPFESLWTSSPLKILKGRD